LFTIFIDDIDDNIFSKILKFADDTKILNKSKTVQDVDKLKTDLSRLFKWSNDWQMLFNIEKCKVMHIGRNNLLSTYSIDGKDLNVVSEEKDLGVIVNNDLKDSKQFAMAASKGNQILGMISRTFDFKDKRIILPMYKSLVRPHLDYCVQAWRPHFVKDISVLEKVQR